MTYEPMMTRISVGTLCLRIVFQDDQPYYPSVLHPGTWNNNGKKLWLALGGGAMLYPETKQYLIDQFDAAEFEGEKRNEPLDARFQVPMSAVDSVLDLFANPKTIGNMVDINPRHELFEELFEQQYNEMDPILHHSLRASFIAGLETQPIGVLVKPLPQDGIGTSPNARSDTPSRHVFYGHDLVLPGPVLIALMDVGHPAFRCLTADELASTSGGLARGQSGDGGTVADNLGLDWTKALL